MSEIEIKECPCYINRPLHRYDKGCLIQSQAFHEQQTEEHPILRCDEIINCPIKENYKQVQQLKKENIELKKKLETATDNIMATLEVSSKAITELNQIKEEKEELKQELLECSLRNYKR